MAVAERPATGYEPILESIARQIGVLGIKSGTAQGAAAVLRIESEYDVQRTVQAFWTPFQFTVPGRCIGLHLEVAEPRVHWSEAYLSLHHRNWVLCFIEREDGDVQLEHYGDYATPAEAVRNFFNLSNWYVLTATDKTWADVVYEVSDEIEWSEHRSTLASSDATSAAVSESLKKSTIAWLRWRTSDGEQSMPVWYVYDQKVEKMYVLSGERQQRIPGAELLREVELILRWKGKNASVAEIPAAVSVITPRDPRWDEIADKIAEKRLNIPGLPEETARRWKDECVILELTLQR